MSLSDKIHDLELFTSEGIPVIIHKLLNEADVKQAVKELKEEMFRFKTPEGLLRRQLLEIIDEIFGEKLI